METNEYNYESVAYVDKDVAEKLVAFLKYSEVEEAVYEVYTYNDTLYNVLVDSKNFSKASTLTDIFLENEFPEYADDDDTSTESKSNDTSKDNDKSKNTDKSEDIDSIDLILYNTFDEKYSDNVSSAYTFLICGLGGLLIIFLNKINVIHLFPAVGISGMISYAVLFILFLTFILIGLNSFKYSKSLKETSKKQQQITNDVLETLRSSLSKEQLDADFNDDIPEEMKYFKRIDIIKDMIKVTHTSLNDDIITSIAETYYNELLNQDLI